MLAELIAQDVLEHPNVASLNAQPEVMGVPPTRTASRQGAASPARRPPRLKPGGSVGSIRSPGSERQTPIPTYAKKE
jgi:hypothetical protein